MNVLQRLRPQRFLTCLFRDLRIHCHLPIITLQLCVYKRLKHFFLLFGWLVVFFKKKVVVGCWSHEFHFLDMQYLIDLNNITHEDVQNRINLSTFDSKSKQWTTRRIRIPHQRKLIFLSRGANELWWSDYKLYFRSLPF